MLWIEIAKMLVLLIFIEVFNIRPAAETSPQYWRTVNFDSVADVAAEKTDSTLGVDLYLERNG